jgi:hypothetical protein
MKQPSYLTEATRQGVTAREALRAFFAECEAEARQIVRGKQ